MMRKRFLTRQGQTHNTPAAKAACRGLRTLAWLTVVSPLALATAAEQPAPATSAAATIAPSPASSEAATASASSATESNAATSTGTNAGSRPTLEEESLPLRTALHHDPTLSAPLKRLVELFRARDSVANLMQMYRSHCAQYPDDANAAIVLLNLFSETKDAAAGAYAEDLRRRFPDDPRVLYASYAVLRQTQSPGAVAVLEEALRRQDDPAQREQWLKELLPLLTAVGQHDRARPHLLRQAELATAPEAALGVAALMQQYGFYAEERALCETALGRSPNPETGVELALRCAAAEAGLGKRAEAGKRLDALLGRLTEDYWRRNEILSRRLALVGTDAERDAMLQAQRALVAAQPDAPAPVRDLARMLAGFDRKREALDCLREASLRNPDASPLVQDALELFDRLNDQRGKEAFLAALLQARPQRHDLALMRIKALYFLARRDDAVAAFHTLAAQDQANALTVHLEMARFLRRSMLPAEARPVFRKAMELAPERADIRRELAETLLLLGDVPGARALFTPEVMTGASAETLADALQFMIRQGMVPEARRIVEARLPQEPANLELRVLLADIQRRLRDFDGGVATLRAARAIADTPARYSQWLDGALAFYRDFDQLPQLLDEEKTALLGALPGNGAVSSDQAEVLQAFARTASRENARAVACELLSDAIERISDPQKRVPLRKQLVNIMTELSPTPPDLEDQMRALAKEDPTMGGEIAMRRILLQLKAQNGAIAVPELQRLEIEKIEDPSLLSQFYARTRNYNNLELTRRLLLRLTVLEPANLRNWETWLSVLAQTSDEERLRLTLRRLLAGIEGVTLEDETKTQLREQLAASLWRSIGRCLSENAENAGNEALLLLNDASGLAGHTAEWQWVTFARAAVLNRLGRNAERDAARQELERSFAQQDQIEEALAATAQKSAANVVGKPSPAQSATPAATAAATPSAQKHSDAQDAGKQDKDGTSAKPAPKRIVLPDGASAVRDALALLLAPAVAQKPQSAPAPLLPQGLNWCLDHDGSSIDDALPAGEGRLVLTSSAGSIFCVDSRTGKLLWKSASSPVAPAVDSDPSGMSYSLMVRRAHYMMMSGMMPNVFTNNPANPFGSLPATNKSVASAPSGVLAVVNNAIVCLDPQTGKRRWETAPVDAASTGPMYIRYANKICLGYVPAKALVFACDAASGKLLWSTKYSAADCPPEMLPLCGWDADDRRVFVYGASAAILDTATGRPLWTFEDTDVATFPLTLKAVVKERNDGPAAAGANTGTPSPTTTTMPYYPGGMRAPTINLNYAAQNKIPALLPSFRLTSPVLAWAAEARPRLGAILDNRIVLCNSERILVLPADLPVVVRSIEVSGTLLALAQRYAFFLKDDMLVRLDLDTGTALNRELPQASAGLLGASQQHPAEAGRFPLTEALTDGQRLYLCGPRGMACLNVRDFSTIAAVPWPKEVQALQQDLPRPNATADTNAYGMIGYPAMYGMPNPVGTQPPQAGGFFTFRQLQAGSGFGLNIAPGRFAVFHTNPQTTEAASSNAAPSVPAVPTAPTASGTPDAQAESGGQAPRSEGIQ